MHISNDPSNFRNKKYLAEMENEFKNMFRAFHKFMSYRRKLLYELTMSDEDKIEFDRIDEKFVRNLNRSYDRIQEYHRDNCGKNNEKRRI